MKKLIFVKIGGSLIADKRKKYVFSKEKTKTLAKILAEYAKKNKDTQFIIGNGGGSFGHYTAKKYGLDKKIKTTAQFFGACLTHNQVVKLNQLVVDIFLKEKLNVFSFSPSSFFLLKNGKVDSYFYNSIIKAVQQGVIPFIFGDVFLDKSDIFRILSTEEVFFQLIKFFIKKRDFKILKVIQVGKEKGVLDKNSKVIESISQLNTKEILRSVFDVDNDVTGGMKNKLLQSLRYAKFGIKTYICSLTSFYDCLNEKKSEYTIIG